MIGKGLKFSTLISQYTQMYLLTQLKIENSQLEMQSADLSTYNNVQNQIQYFQH